MIKNIDQLEKQFSHGAVLLELAEKVLHCIQPSNLLHKAVSVNGNILHVQKKKYNLKNYNRIFVVGAGKATYSLAEGIYDILGDRIVDGHINVPVAYKKKIGPISVTKASHPFPNEAGVKGAQKILDIVKSAQPDDLVITLITGGGSALMPLPIPGVTLEEKTRITKQLMLKSADIIELNALRKHLSAIKGGQLAEAAAPAMVVSLIISDVLEDKLDVIASGPTVPDSSTREDALAVLERYKVGNARIRKLIAKHGTPTHLNTSRVHNHLIGNNHVALDEIVKHAKEKKLTTRVLTSCLRGEAKDVAQVLTSIAKEIDVYQRPVRKPALIIAGGETTVTVKGKGHGGRNQELVLAAVPFMNERMSILSLATDGVDGITPTPVAGAMADGAIMKQCVIDRINYHDYLYSNNSFECLKQLGCLLHTGPTGTNVGDIVMILVT